MEYKEYLSSEHWKQLRDKKKHRCAICGSKDRLETHHLFYRNLFDCGTEDLRRLCHECHRVAHELLKAGKINPKKPNSHHSVFSATKVAVKRFRFGNPCISEVAIQIREQQTSKGGWTKESLAKWGIPWPPPPGWKHALESRQNSS